MQHKTQAHNKSFKLWPPLRYGHLTRTLNAKEGIVATSNNKKFLALISLLIIPSLAQANAGVPMIFLVMPAFALSIIPIIIVEAIYIAKYLELSGKESVKTVTISNLVSTIVGIPLTWGILVVIQIVTGGGSAYGLNTAVTKILAVTWQAPWLIPYESDLHWMIPIAALVLIIPFFFVSWWSEYFVTKILIKNIDTSKIKKVVRNANLITYGLLALWPIVMLVVPND